MSGNDDNGSRHLIRHNQMFWIAAGVTVSLMAWFTLAFFRDEWNMHDVPVEIVFIGLAFIASYVGHNKIVVQHKCPGTRDMPGHRILILALVWTAILMTLYQTKAFEHLLGMERVAVPEHFYRFIEFLAGIFGISSIWNFFPRPRNNSKGNNVEKPSA